MGRPKSFAPSEALDAAMRAFWRDGYHATSVEDLTRATGLNRSSLYATFGDKRSLFLAALQRFVDERCKMVASVIRECEGLEGIRAFWHGFASDVCNGELPSCLVHRAGLELGRSDDEVRDCVKDPYDDLRQAYADVIERSCTLNEIDGDHAQHVGELSALCIVVHRGIMSAAGYFTDEAELRRAVDQFLDLLVGAVKSKPVAP